MSYTNLHFLKIYAFVGLVVLVIGLPVGATDVSFGETTKNTDIVMSIDPNGSPAEKAQALNHLMTVLAAAFVQTKGNVEILLRDGNELCLSALNDRDGCSSGKNLQAGRDLTDVESHDTRIIIHSASDE